MRFKRSRTRSSRSTGLALPHACAPCYQALAIAQELEYRFMEGQTLESYAELARVCGDAEGRRAHLLRAKDLWETADAPIRAEQVARKLASA